jgi:hypothetical protein
MSNVNDRLLTSTETTRSFAVTPKQLAEYLQSIPLKAGAKMKDVQLRTEDGKLIANGAVEGGFGSTAFNLEIEQDPATHRLVVVSKDIQSSGTHRLIKDDIEHDLTYINDTLSREVNKKINNKWEVSTLNIGDNEIDMNFKKKAT